MQEERTKEEIEKEEEKWVQKTFQKVLTVNTGEKMRNEG